MNNSSFDNFEDQPTCPHAVSTTLTALISFVSLSAFVGNFLITVIFVMNASLRTSTNYFIVNMAVSDLLSALTNWPLYATEGMLSRKSVMKDSMATFVCKLGMYSRTFSQMVSVLSLVLIVVDRFIAVVRPFHATRITTRLRAVLLLSTWLVSLTSAFPYVWFSKIVQEDGQTFCSFAYSWSKIGVSMFYTVGILTLYCIPLILISVLYSKIMKCLTRTRPVDETRRQSIRMRNRQQNRIVMKVFLSIVTAFFLCYTPLPVYVLLKMVIPSLFAKDTCLLLLGLSYYVLPSLSTAVNPVILFVSSSRFSKPLKEMFRCLICKVSCRSGRVSPQREVIEPVQGQ